MVPAPGAGTFCSSQVLPLSLERHRPKGPLVGVSHVATVPLMKKPKVVDAQRVVRDGLPAVAGSMMMRATALPAKGPGLPNRAPSPASCFQLRPPSTERRIPRP